MKIRFQTYSAMLIPKIGLTPGLHNAACILELQRITLPEFFLTAGHPLTVPNRVILSQKNDAIK